MISKWKKLHTIYIKQERILLEGLFLKTINVLTWLFTPSIWETRLLRLALQIDRRNERFKKIQGVRLIYE